MVLQVFELQTHALKGLLSMCRILTRSLIVAFSLTLGHAAFAADLPQRPTAAPLFAPTPVYNWTGIYFGVNGGGGWGRQEALNIISKRFEGDSIDFSGGVFGGTAGAQIQSGHVVLGFEADLNWAGLKGSGTFFPTILGVPSSTAITATTKIDWEATARARIGYANDNWLFYATGGLAVLGAKTSFTPGLGVTCGTIGFINCSGTDKQVGAALGAGIEYGITPNFSAKLEYLYLTAASLDISHHSEIRAGLNYRFGGM
jgi:outer membrane immunogenic protein